MRQPIEAAVQLIGLEKLVPEEQPEQGLPKNFSAKNTWKPLRRITPAITLDKVL